MSKTCPQPPDIEGNSTDGLAGALPQGSSLQGATATCHPGMSHAELHQGFERLNADGTKGDQREGDELGYAPTQTGGGFCDRSGGWER